MTASPPMLCFVGPSNSGKTTIVSKLIARLCERGVRVGAIKHASHRFDMDRPGKDTYRFREAGAYAVAIASKTERAVITSTEQPATLAELAASLPAGLEVIIVEGYKSEGSPKVEVHRGHFPVLPDVDGLVAIVSEVDREGAGVPQFRHDDIDGLCDFVMTFAGRA